MRAYISGFELQDGPAVSLKPVPGAGTSNTPSSTDLLPCNASTDMVTTLKPFRNFEFIACAPIINVSTQGILNFYLI